MNRRIIMIACGAILLLSSLFLSVNGGLNSKGLKFDLKKTFDLGSSRSSAIQYYEQISKVSHFSLDGSPAGREVYRLKLRYVPSRLSRLEEDSIFCKALIVQKDEGPAIAIPVLQNWTYQFKRTETGLDEKGQVFGIDHARFENLKDANGQTLMADAAYAVYNTFIDFHSFCNGLGERTAKGKGIQDLKSIGDRIVHDAAFSEPPVNLGSIIAAGSKFKNGEITLKFKGLTIQEGEPCALIGFDSGESSFTMLMKPVPNMDIQARGRSHYWGEMSISLNTYWIQGVDMTESVITEVKMPMPPNKINQVVERQLTIRSITKEEFDRE